MGLETACDDAPTVRPSTIPGTELHVKRGYSQIARRMHRLLRDQETKMQRSCFLSMRIIALSALSNAFCLIQTMPLYVHVHKSPITSPENLAHY